MVTKDFGLSNQSDLDLNPMALVPELGLNVVKMPHHTKNEVSMSRHSKVLPRTHTHTHPHAHIQYENITFPHTRAVTMYVTPTFTILPSEQQCSHLHNSVDAVKDC